MATPIRTFGPLHLEDLDPHRFEDLVRQLLYDFRPWRTLESTGRSGADEGFDARGWEAIGGEDEQSDEPNGEDGAVIVGQEDRLWLVQAKREKAIGPKKLVKYLNDIPEAERKAIYGIIFVAACDFSKTARDQFRETIRSFGVSEGHLWGKGEVEDQLFQPKNDHLLFAYFGISLQVRRRSLTTEVRARLATKRKAKRILDQRYGQVVLVRDASDDRYPYQEPDEELANFDRRRWYTYTVEGCYHDGIHLQCRRHMAFVEEDGVHWDYATENEAKYNIYDDPWAPRDNTLPHPSEDSEIWRALSEGTKAWYEVFVVLPYENIIEIDKDGDEWFDKPHIYTIDFSRENGPFRRYRPQRLQTIERFNQRSCEPDEERRVTIFPREQDKR